MSKNYQNYQLENECLRSRNAWLECCLACALAELRKAFDYDKAIQTETELDREVEERR